MRVGCRRRGDRWQSVNGTCRVARGGSEVVSVEGTGMIGGETDSGRRVEAQEVCRFTGESPQHLAPNSVAPRSGDRYQSPVHVATRRVIQWLG